MKNTFSKFLVDEGAISSEALVCAFIKQAEDSPSLPQLVKDHQLLSNSEILEVYAHQVKHEASFQSSCMTLGVWSAELEAKLESVILQSVPSIFKILVDQELISLSAMTMKMDEFIANVLDEPEAYGLHAA